MRNLDIYKRCEDFAVKVIQLLETIPYRRSVGIISDQLMRSTSSVGANLNEADNARSRKEFLSYLGISLREIKESIYWFKLLKRTNLMVFQNIDEIEQEAIEIKKILGAIFEKTKY